MERRCRECLEILPEKCFDRLPFAKPRKYASCKVCRAKKLIASLENHLVKKYDRSVADELKSAKMFYIAALNERIDIYKARASEPEHEPEPEPDRQTLAAGG